jgi:hypothetical protein
LLFSSSIMGVFASQFKTETHTLHFTVFEIF